MSATSKQNSFWEAKLMQFLSVFDNQNCITNSFGPIVIHVCSCLPTQIDMDEQERSKRGPENSDGNRIPKVISYHFPFPFFNKTVWQRGTLILHVIYEQIYNIFIIFTYIYIYIYIYILLHVSWMKQVEIVWWQKL